jgi:hypothetical protein
VSAAAAQIPSGWTCDTYAIHADSLRHADKEFQAERDRRYGEVALEREKALKIKETADLAALGLAREIQDYKDDKAYQQTERTNMERGQYATQADLAAAIGKIEAALGPVLQFVAGQRGRTQGIGVSANVVVVVFGMFLTIVGLYLAMH